ncbi:hypothetical protein Q0Z83_059910 [Actinoplanes sichuanensis]|uniref:Uncharacterized protein n=1 Tax=Actinoplanes sichuanensis TaxID=512349 RepID=A0ABW4A7S2_9ACTN|nr:hypothetical protein [Actinoplanes sichuanensis]BEL07800.1 hypothetical protein Q0Z83_059910 [Actinoplanes sichuanensis]
MGLFGSKTTTTRADGVTVAETRSKTKVTYPNGDFETTDKKTGRQESWAKIRPDGKRERDGK